VGESLTDDKRPSALRQGTGANKSGLKRGRLPKRGKSSFLIRHILPSDAHSFVGRIFDLGIVQLHFETYEELAQHADCKYAFDVNTEVSSLTRRVESLNLAGHLLWPEPFPHDFKTFPISRYQWLIVAADVFLMRYISVVDCAMLLVNSVYELGLEAKHCSVGTIRKNGVPENVIGILEEMVREQGDLRKERNARFHHGVERGFTQDDLTFRITALMEHRMGGVAGGGQDRFGRKVNIDRMFKEALVELQREFNRVTRRMVRQLDRLYDELWSTFEDRFRPRIRNSTHGLRVSKTR
jgi:hypothetical protein